MKERKKVHASSKKLLKNEFLIKVSDLAHAEESLQV